MPPRPDQLFDLYKVAVEEYRFAVKLGWDRTMYYMVFNTGIVSVGTGLLRLESRPLSYWLIAAIFLLGFLTSLIARVAIRKGHEYYRRSVVKKTVLEDMLGLTCRVTEYPTHHTLAVGTTTGQAEHLQILHDPEQWVRRSLRPGSIVYWLSAILLLLAAINLGGVAVAVWLEFHSGAQSKPNPPMVVPITSESPISIGTML
jgi:hypothetical protein